MPRATPFKDPVASLAEVGHRVFATECGLKVTTQQQTSGPSLRGAESLGVECRRDVEEESQRGTRGFIKRP